MSREGSGPGELSVLLNALEKAALTGKGGSPDISDVLAARAQLHSIHEHQRGRLVLLLWLRLIFEAHGDQRTLLRALMFPLLEHQVFTLGEMLDPGTWNELHSDLVVAFRVDEAERIESVDEHGVVRMRPHDTAPGGTC